jgi:hypothetical protein
MGPMDTINILDEKWTYPRARARIVVSLRYSLEFYECDKMGTK